MRRVRQCRSIPSCHTGLLTTILTVFGRRDNIINRTLFYIYCTLSSLENRRRLCVYVILRLYTRYVTLVVYTQYNKRPTDFRLRSVFEFSENRPPEYVHPEPSRRRRGKHARARTRVAGSSSGPQDIAPRV